MAGARLVTALLGIVLSLGLSILLWQYFGSPIFFLLVPFVPFLFRRGRSEPPVRVCEECGFTTHEASFEYCPRDGRRLVEQDQSAADRV